MEKHTFALRRSFASESLAYMIASYNVHFFRAWRFVIMDLNKKECKINNNYACINKLISDCDNNYCYKQEKIKRIHKNNPSISNKCNWIALN